MDMYISLGRLRHLEHRKPDADGLGPDTQERIEMREIDHAQRAGLGSSPIRRNLLLTVALQPSFWLPRVFERVVALLALPALSFFWSSA